MQSANIKLSDVTAAIWKGNHRIPTQFTTAEIENTCRLYLDARSATHEFSKEIGRLAKRTMLEPVVLRQYIVARATEKLDELATRQSQIEMLLG